MIPYTYLIFNLGQIEILFQANICTLKKNGLSIPNVLQKKGFLIFLPKIIFACSMFNLSSWSSQRNPNKCVTKRVPWAQSLCVGFRKWPDNKLSPRNAIKVSRILCVAVLPARRLIAERGSCKWPLIWSWVTNMAISLWQEIINAGESCHFVI